MTKAGVWGTKAVATVTSVKTFPRRDKKEMEQIRLSERRETIIQNKYCTNLQEGNRNSENYWQRVIEKEQQRSPKGQTK